jgi:hypothetical protein
VAAELSGLVRDFPNVTVETVGGAFVLNGIVGTAEELRAVDAIAATAKIKSLVRYDPDTLARRRAEVEAAAAAAVEAEVRAKKEAAERAARGELDGPYVMYDIELLEASANHRSGSYATGVEPSGRRLFKGSVKAPFGGEGVIFIGGAAVDPKKKPEPNTPESGIRLHLRPSAPSGRGFHTFILVETNLPIGKDSADPSIWRRARWEIDVASGEPFGITGGDLLATPDVQGGGGLSGSQIVTAARVVPGSGSVLRYIPIFGSLFGSRNFQSKKTQLLVIMRPQVTQGDR